MFPAEFVQWPVFATTFAAMGIFAAIWLLSRPRTARRARRARTAWRCRFGWHIFVPLAGAELWLPLGRSILECRRCGVLLVAG